MPDNLVYGEQLFRGCRLLAISLLCPLKAERECTGLWTSVKGTNPIYKGGALMTYLPPQGSTSKCHHIGNQALTYEFWETQTLSPLARGYGGEKKSVIEKIQEFRGKSG